MAVVLGKPARLMAVMVACVIGNGTITLGVGTAGNIDLPKAGAGLVLDETGGDARIPGCLCGGWGVADLATGPAAWATVDLGPCQVRGEVVSVTATATTATSVVESDGGEEVRDDDFASAVAGVDPTDSRWSWRRLVGDFVPNIFIPASTGERKQLQVPAGRQIALVGSARFPRVWRSIWSWTTTPPTSIPTAIRGWPSILGSPCTSPRRRRLG